MSTKSWTITDESGRIFNNSQGSSERVLIVTDEGSFLFGDGDPKSGRDELDLVIKALEAVIPKMPPGSDLAAAHSAKATLQGSLASSAMMKRLGIPSVEDALEAAEAVAAKVIADHGRSYPAGEGLDGPLFQKAADEMALAIRRGIAERLAPKG